MGEQDCPDQWRTITLPVMQLDKARDEALTRIIAARVHHDFHVTPEYLRLNGLEFRDAEGRDFTHEIARTINYSSHENNYININTNFEIIYNEGKFDSSASDIPSPPADPGPAAGWPDLPRYWRLFSFILPPAARERYFDHSCEDMVIAYAEATRFVRTDGERRWVLFAFGIRSLGLYTASILAVSRDLFVAALRWVALLTLGRQMAGRLIAWVENVIIGP